MRRFFVDFTFPIIFDNKEEKNYKKTKKDEQFTSNMFDFVKSTRGHIHITFPGFKDDIIKFFIDMRVHADKVFNEKIDRDCEDVCLKAENLGVLEPKTLIVISNDLISFVPIEKYKEVGGDIIGTYYKIAPALFELWVKPSDKGKMLEVWIYNILESHFKDRNVIIIPCVKLRMQDESAKGATKIKDLITLYDERGEYLTPKYDLTDLDCVILDKNTNKPIIIIECKAGNDAGRNALLHLYGVIKLLDADEGILIAGSDNAFHSDQDFENIRIIPNVVNREDFPRVLIDHLEIKLKALGL